MRHQLPFNPMLDSLYTGTDLLGDFDPNQPDSYRTTVDFRTYRYFVKHGRYAPKEYFDGMMQSLHDNSITQALRDFINEHERVVAIMGGHKLQRSSGEYKKVALIARQLSRAGFLVTSGGGPGAMEAAHLGALFAKTDDAALDEALGKLSGQAPFPPNLIEIVDESGEVNEALAKAVHAWYLPVLEILHSIADESRGVSLAIPTWHYGHEPFTPLATHIAKYFQNSIREDGLLAVARHGIVYAEGKAGTLQEIFQDAAQNYYASFGWFSPMVLLGREYWTVKIPVVATLEALFGAEKYAKYVLLTDSVDETVQFINAFNPPA